MHSKGWGLCQLGKGELCKNDEHKHSFINISMGRYLSALTESVFFTHLNSSTWAGDSMVQRRKQASFPLSSPWMQCTHRLWAPSALSAMCRGVSFFHSTLYFPPDHKARSLSWAPATIVWGLLSDDIYFRLSMIDWLLQDDTVSTWLLGSLQYKGL